MNNPPVIDGEPDEHEVRSNRSTPGNPWSWLSLFVGTAIIARVIMQRNVALPVCGFHHLTGVPCPLCGGTRALGSIAELDLLAAIQFNPLVFLGGALITLWALLRMLDRLLGTRLEKTLRQHTNRLPLAFIALGFIVLNWLYLIRVLE